MNEQIWTTKDVLKFISVSMLIAFALGLVVGYEIGYVPPPIPQWKPLIG
jgi:hypothetical protein